MFESIILPLICGALAGYVVSLKNRVKQLESDSNDLFLAYKECKDELERRKKL